MNKQVIALLTIMGVLVAFLFLVYTFAAKPATEVANVQFDQKPTTYFFGVTCPNCKALNDWINKEKMADKVKFVKREVYYNKQNAAMLEQAAAICKIPNNQIGVPFIFHQGKCYVGVPQAQEILTKLAKKKK